MSVKGTMPFFLIFACIGSYWLQTVVK